MTVIACMAFCLLFLVVTVATRALRLCPEQFVVSHITIMQSISKVRVLWWNSLCFNFCSPTNLQFSLTGKEVSDTSRCNFCWVVMCHESKLPNYSSVTVMMTLWFWCIQILVSFHFTHRFLSLFIRMRYWMRQGPRHRRLCRFVLLLSPYTVHKNTTCTCI